MRTSVSSKLIVQFMHFTRNTVTLYTVNSAFSHALMGTQRTVSVVFHHCPINTFAACIPWLCFKFLGLINNAFQSKDFKTTKSTGKAIISHSVSWLHTTPYTVLRTAIKKLPSPVEGTVTPRLEHFGNPCCHALGGAADVAVVSRHKLLAFFCL